MVVKKKAEQKSMAITTQSADPTDLVAFELKKAREASGMSFSDLHRITGLSRTTIHQYESELRKPGAREIRLLCDALRVTPNQLLYGTEQPFKEKSRLHALLDVSNEDLRTARLAMFLTMLNKNERDAWITLLGESIKSRTGGGEKLNMALDAIEAATDFIATDMADALNTALPQQKIDELGQSIEAKVAAKVKARSRNKK